MESESCFRVDIIEAIMSSQKGHIDNLETSLIYGDFLDIIDYEVRDYVMWMDSFGQNKRKYFESLGSIPTHPIPSVEKPLTLDMPTLVPLPPYRSLSCPISLKWKRRSC